MDNVIIYAHDRDQDTALRELMLDYQVVGMKLFGYRNRLNVMHVYRDENKEQPELKHLISLASQNKLRGIDYMLIYKWESISEWVDPVMELVDLFYEKGIDVRPVTDWQLNSQLSWLYRFKTGKKSAVRSLKNKGITWVKVQW